MNKLQRRLHNENCAVERVRIVCYGHKREFKDINFGSHITLEHGPDYKDDHNVIAARANGIKIGNVIHKKTKGDYVCNVRNNDEIIDLIEDGMTVNLVAVRDYNIFVDIPLKRFKGLL